MAQMEDVAQYILEQAGPMGEFKLHRLLYYSQAWHWTWEDRPLFNEQFEAWAGGPVLARLNTFLRGFHGYTPVELADMPGGKSGGLDAGERESVDQVLAEYGHRASHWLSSLSRMERPWKEARGDASVGDECHNVISPVTMIDYYGGLSDAQ